MKEQLRKKQHPFLNVFRGNKLLVPLLVIIFIYQLFRQSKSSIHNPDQENDHKVLAVAPSKHSTVRTRHHLRILSLGGSVTWGSRLPSRSDAYPYQIKPGSFVSNLALRASGSDYPSLCLQSMVNDDLRQQGIQDVEGFQFDLITIEFSLNGIAGLDLLLKRLKERYPNAMFVYVHLLSPRMGLRDQKTGKMPRDILADTNLKFTDMDRLTTEALADPNANWIWDVHEIIESKRMEYEAVGKMKKLGGKVWSFPINNDLNEVFPLFMPDRHHLNSEGHSVVAAGIRNTLSEYSSEVDVANRDHNTIGSWGKGDFCYIWFETGTSPLLHTGGVLKLFIKPNKFAHHMSIGNGTSTISVDNKMSWPMPLSVMYMVWHPQYYPKTKVTITSNTGDHTIVTSEPFILNPIHENEEMQSWHVTFTTKVGMANPGRNTVSFECLEKTKKPLRVTGIVMCGACEEFTTTTIII